MFVTDMESECTPSFLFQRFTRAHEWTDLLNFYVVLVPALQDHSTGTEAFVMVWKENLCMIFLPAV